MAEFLFNIWKLDKNNKTINTWKIDVTLKNTLKTDQTGGIDLYYSVVDFYFVFLILDEKKRYIMITYCVSIFQFAYTVEPL